MGLATVELIMRVEEEFGIEITDADAERISTPGTLCALVESKLSSRHTTHATSNPSSCSTSSALYTVRRQLMQLGVERNRVTPRTSLESLWPRSQRRKNWKALGHALNYSLPDLHRSPEWAFVGLLPLGVFPVWFAFSPDTGILACIGYVLAWRVGSWLTAPLATHTPEWMESVGDLCRRLAPRFGQTNLPSDLWPLVRDLIADELSLPTKQITRDADFFRNLGLD